MGGSSKKVTVGYMYYLGMHLILCHGPVDRIVRIRVDKRDAWIGNRRSGRINIRAANLFGGESREGGIEGAVDFEPGEATQGQNDYLRSRLGSLVPNYRGVVGIVLRQVFVGLNPYLKNWDFRISRVLTRQDGIPQWYAQTAVIPTAESFRTQQRILFCLDTSTSMNDSVGFLGPETRFSVMKANMIRVLDEIAMLAADAAVPVDIAITTMHSASISYQGVTQSNINSLKSFVLGLTTSASGTYFTGFFSYAKSWFSPLAAGQERRNVMCIVTDGQPTMSQFPDALAEAAPILNRSGTWSDSNEVDVYGVNIDYDNTNYTRQLDNTGGDGVPVVDGASDDGLYNAVFFAFMGDSPAMNIVHAIRECLTDPDWGMGYAENDIDDESFRKAADRLRQERLGICIQWDRQKPIQDMISEFLRHADAALYVDRKTGLFTIKLIREDYNKGDLLHLTEANIQKVDNFSRPAFGELTTSITVNYWNVTTGENASVKAQDIALSAMQQATVETTLQYPGLPDPVMASKVANRALRLMSSQLAKCSVYADRSAKGVTIGDAIRITWSEYGLEDTVFRVTEVAYGNGKSNRIKLGLIEDAFGAPVMNYITPAPPEWEDPSQAPGPTTRQLAFEAPYLEMVQRQGATVVDAVLLDNPQAGYVGVAAMAPPVAAINARAHFNSGAGYEDIGVLDFSPGGTLVDPVGKYDEVFTLQGSADLDTVTINSWAQIEDELVSILEINGSSVTVKRGILDTVPSAHPADAHLICWDETSTLDSTEFVASDVVATKITPVSGGGVVPLESATEMVVNVEGRAARPYRPANLRIGGSLLVDENSSINYPINATWVHRNRLQETAGIPLSWTDPSVTPEDGTTYQVTMLGESSEGILTQFFQQDVGAVTSYTIDLAAHTIPGGSAVLVFQVRAVRDGLASWKAAGMRLPLLSPPTGLDGVTGTMFAVKDAQAYAVGGGV